MDRRLVGALTLFVAVMAVIVVPRLLSPGIAGAAAAEAMPAPPAVGTCVDYTRRTLTVIDCANPHVGEVTYAWRAEDTLAVTVTRDRCADAARVYIGTAVDEVIDGWEILGMQVATRVLRAPADQRVGDYGWVACVLRTPDRERYVGTVRALSALETRPDVFGTCQFLGELGRCDRSHYSEVLATMDGDVAADSTADSTSDSTPPGSSASTGASALVDRLNDECRGIARLLLDTSDPTFGGVLDVRVRIGNSVTTTNGAPGIAGTRYSASCEVTSADRPLAGSLLGIGSDPLPWA